MKKAVRPEIHSGQEEKTVINTNIPEHSIEAIARCLLPDIIAN